MVVVLCYLNHLLGHYNKCNNSNYNLRLFKEKLTKIIMNGVAVLVLVWWIAP